VIPREREFHTSAAMQHSTMIRPFTVAIIRKTFCTRRHNKQSMLLVTKQYQAEMMNFIFVDYFSSNTQWQRLICYDCSQISATTKQKSGKLHSRWIEGVCVCGGGASRCCCCCCYFSSSCVVLLFTIVTWLILPVVICLSQRLSHACLSINVIQ
jgi:hypothetical protein